MNIDNVLARFAGKRVLLLQGPVGPFFSQLSMALRQAGARVDKVNFNGGDWIFYPRHAHSYRGTLQDWPAELDWLVKALRIQAVIVFGDCRPIHMPAHHLMEELGVEVWAFEEGYVRPNFVTFEPHGVNNRSRLPRDPDVYLNAEPRTLPVERDVGNTFWWAAIWAIVYYVAAFLLQPAFRRDLHHRPLATREFLPWLISPLRKLKYKFFEQGVERRLSGLLSKRYFLVPLQVHVDAQVLVHSRFASVPDFIDAVTASFARSANPTDVLAIKQHPMDRGYHDYSKFIRRLAHKYGVRDRVLYIHDQHLPTLLANARGVVLINSTVGLSALHHGTPLKVMGEALYDIPGLTAQCGLDQFWQEPEKWVRDERLYRSFRAQLVLQTQLNGSFYRSGLFRTQSPPAFTLRPDHNAASERPLELKPKGSD